MHTHDKSINYFQILCVVCIFKMKRILRTTAGAFPDLQFLIIINKKINIHFNQIKQIT